MNQMIRKVISCLLVLDLHCTFIVWNEFQLEFNSPIDNILHIPQIIDDDE